MSGATGASVAPETRITRKKRNMKLLAMSPPRKYPTPNQDINMFGTDKDQSLLPQPTKFRPGYKSLGIEVENYHNNSTDTSRTYKEYSVENLKAMNNININDEYKEENLQHQHINEIVIKKTKQ